MKAIELRIKETLSGSISYKGMVSHCACNDISVLVFLVSMFLSLPSQNSFNELEKQGICSVEGNNVCADCSAPSKHGKHPTFPSTCLLYILLHCYTHLSSLLHCYLPLILLHCYTHLSSSFIATYLSSSFIHCAKNWVYAIGYFAYISSLRIKNPTCGMNQFRTVHISSILNRITCA